MEKYLTKRNVTGVSCSIAGVMLIVNYFGTYAMCNQDSGCAHLLANSILVFYPFLPFAALSLLTYKMRNEIFRSWINFAKWWVPITMLLILIIPGDSGGWGISFPPLDGVFALYSSGFFLLISLILIAYKFFTLRKDGIGK